ncbi:hypothetical protein V8C86DRAFT_3083253 [Haematococcus lacustris]
MQSVQSVLAPDGQPPLLLDTGLGSAPSAGSPAPAATADAAVLLQLSLSLKDSGQLTAFHDLFQAMVSRAIRAHMPPASSSAAAAAAAATALLPAASSTSTAAAEGLAGRAEGQGSPWQVLPAQSWELAGPQGAMLGAVGSGLLAEAGCSAHGGGPAGGVAELALQATPHPPPASTSSSPSSPPAASRPSSPSGSQHCLTRTPLRSTTSNSDAGSWVQSIAAAHQALPGLPCTPHPPAASPERSWPAWQSQAEALQGEVGSWSAPAGSTASSCTSYQSSCHSWDTNSSQQQAPTTATCSTSPAHSLALIAHSPALVLPEQDTASGASSDSSRGLTARRLILCGLTSPRQPAGAAAAAPGLLSPPQQPAGAGAQGPAPLAHPRPLTPQGHPAACCSPDPALTEALQCCVNVSRLSAVLGQLQRRLHFAPPPALRLPGAELGLHVGAEGPPQQDMRQKLLHEAAGCLARAHTSHSQGLGEQASKDLAQALHRVRALHQSSLLSLWFSLWRCSTRLRHPHRTTPAATTPARGLTAFTAPHSSRGKSRRRHAPQPASALEPHQSSSSSSSSRLCCRLTSTAAATAWRRQLQLWESSCDSQSDGSGDLDGSSRQWGDRLHCSSQQPSSSSSGQAGSDDRPYTSASSHSSRPDLTAPLLAPPLLLTMVSCHTASQPYFAHPALLSLPTATSIQLDVLRAGLMQLFSDSQLQRQTVG